jgi:murein DD-endopeptidase MepM/ murein hydrolase activator NlpD
MSRGRQFLAALSTVLLVAGFVPAATADEFDDQLDEVRRRIDLLAGQIDDSAASRSALAGQVRAAQAQMDEVLGALDVLRRDLGLIGARLVAKERSLREARSALHQQYQTLALTRSDLAQARSDAATWAVELYMSAGRGAPEVAFSAQAWNDVVIGISYLERVTESGVETVARLDTLLGEEERTGAVIEATEATLTAEVVALEGIQAELVQVEVELDAKSEELAAVFARQRQLLAAVDAQIAELEGELAALEQQEDSIRDLIDERARDDGRPPGTLVRPVPGAITSGFGPRWHPILGYMRMHNGLDMNCDTGDPIVAAGSGTVILAEVKGGYGKTIMVDHGGGMVTLYAHQSGYAVSQGSGVDAGQVIGYCGSTGQSTGPHLHFEVRITGNPVDPEPYL